MINKLKLYFYKIKIVFITSAIVFFLGLFFGFNKTIKAEQTDYELSFYIDEFNSYSLFYSEGETIEEIPTLDSNLLFVGWYDNEFYNGVNYYGEAVDELTPNILYALIYYKDPVLDDLEVVPYLDGYEIVLYKGSVVDTYLNIPSYYIEETETEGLYEAKDILSISESTFANNNNPAYITIPKMLCYEKVGHVGST